MIEVIENLWDYDINLVDVYSYLFYGEGATTSIKEYIKNSLKSKCVIFKACGMMDNIVAAQDYGGELIYFDEGDASKFFVKNFPELAMLFPVESDIEQIIDDWICTCYERRILYFVDVNNLQSFIDMLLECKFDTSVCYEKVWPLIESAIENSPEAPEHDMFVLVTKHQLL